MKSRHQALRGFTLIEVLVSLLILLIGLLGIALLMIKGQRATFEAYQRQQALALAQDMSEKIRSNQAAAPRYVPATVAQSLSDRIAVLSAACPPDPTDNCQIALADLTEWNLLLAGAAETKDATTNRVGGMIGARGCIEWDGDVAQPVFRVSVVWQGEADTLATNAGVSACGAGLYGNNETDTLLHRRRIVTLSIGTCKLIDAATGGCA